MSAEETVIKAQETPDTLIACILDMGELLLTSGAEVLRVEDTLTRLCTAYQFRRINVFSITSSIVLTVEDAGVHEGWFRIPLPARPYMALRLTREKE